MLYCVKAKAIFQRVFYVKEMLKLKVLCGRLSDDLCWLLSSFIRKQYLKKALKMSSCQQLFSQRKSKKILVS